MPQIYSEYFGTVTYGPDSIFQFPAGLPGFEEETFFVAIEIADQRPLAYLQSTRNPDLCFLALPVATLCAGYQLNILPDDLELLGFAEGDLPRSGVDVLCLAIISVEEGSAATANLLAPIVVNLATRQSVQCIQTNSAYTVRHPVSMVAAALEQTPCC